MTRLTTCSKCGEPREVGKMCRPCQRRYERERYPLIKHRYAEKNAARARAWNAANRERRRENERRRRLRNALKALGLV